MANVEATYALTDQERVKRHLGITAGSSADEWEINQLINEISVQAQNWMGRNIRSRTYTHDGTTLPRLDSRGGRKLWLRESPVTAVSSLKVYPGTSALTAWNGPTGDYIIRADIGVIELVAGEWLDASGVVEITYTAGYQDSPAAGTEHVYGYKTAAADLELAIVQQVAWVFRGKDRVREGVISETMEGVSRTYFDGRWLKTVESVLDSYRRILPSW